MESHNPLQNNKYTAKDEDAIREIIESIETGEEVWVPWGESVEVIDFYKYNKYQGSIEVISAVDNLFNAYKLNHEIQQGDKLFLMNMYPISFDYAALLLLATASQ